MLTSDKTLSAPQDLALFGLETMAYIRPVTVGGQRMHLIHAADGTPLTMVEDRALAFATIRQYEMDPVSVH